VKYLLIDFGASYVKAIEFDRDTNTWSTPRTYDSPFLTQISTTKAELRNLLTAIAAEYTVDAVVVCSILGGHYIGDIYHSWKSPIKGKACGCMISGLFNEEPTFHVHTHHKDFTSASKYEDGLRVLGYVNNTPIYSSLGDTYCVIESVELSDTHVGINIGTGSQVFYLENGQLEIDMFIPAGRAFLVFQRFFEEMGVDMFDHMSRLSVDEVVNSSLWVNLNVFKEARNYEGGGFIELINETNFTKSNLIASILKDFVTQYVTLIPDDSTHIHLLGGISKKIKILPELFKWYLPMMTIEVHNGLVENTHLGMSRLIRRHL
jgi:hypothetical protein